MFPDVRGISQGHEAVRQAEAAAPRSPPLALAVPAATSAALSSAELVVRRIVMRMRIKAKAATDLRGVGGTQGSVGWGGG